MNEGFGPYVGISAARQSARQSSDIVERRPEVRVQESPEQDDILA
jgi:hypothetical protein